MRLVKASSQPMAEGDMTPMIDMTFQLIAFFMVLLNFGEAEVDARINLPSSELAQPPEKGPDSHFTLQLMKTGNVLLGGDEVPLASLEALLYREKDMFESKDTDTTEVTIIIRADSDVKTGDVQEMIRICQKVGFEQFQLNAKQSEPD